MQQVKKLPGKDDILIPKLLKFFSESHKLKIFRDIVVEGKYISLRLFDFFVTNYAKTRQIWIADVDIHKDYKQNLNGYKKRYFDPFCRNKRVYLSGKGFSILQANIQESQNKTLHLEIKDTANQLQDEICTTIGQLNFFRWCIQKGVIEYILNHHQTIEKYMSKRKTTTTNNNNTNTLIIETKPSTIARKQMRFTIMFSMG
jgi:hypothetical protein